MLFKNFSVEVGDPNKLLFVAKLSNPALLGVRIRISVIKERFNTSQIILTIVLITNLSVEKLNFF